MKKSVVMISYFFPPEGSAGTYRSLRFVRQLAKIGWSPAVIAANPYGYERYDPDLLTLVPNDIEITRVRGHDPWQAIQNWRGKKFQEAISGASVAVANQKRAAHHKPLRSLVRKAIRTVENSFYQPDLARPWIRPAVSAAVKVCKTKRPDVLWASAGPISAWIVARKVSRAVGVPYVLDLRDPHGLSYYDPELQRPEWVARRMRRTMYRLFKDARAVIFLFDSVAECYYRAFPGALDPARIHIIPNGYEGNVDDSAPPTGDTFNVLYTGTVVSYRYDTLFRALAKLNSKSPAKAQRLRVKFVGEGTDELAELAAILSLSNIVEIAGPTSHAEITRLEREAHALLVLGRLSTIKGHELLAGAKVFNYLKASRPIFGVLPRDETRNVLSSVGVSTIADVDSPAEIAAQLEKLIDAWSAKNLQSLLPDRAKCRLYSAEQQTEALVRALIGASATQPFVHGSVEVPPSLRATMTAQAVRVSDYGWI
jgi:glycosyltransferase involved in cell wall biosynthesis